MLNQIGSLGAIGLGVVAGSILFASQGRAAFIATIEQVGPNVVVTGSGSLNMTGLTFEGATSDVSGIYPAVAALAIGSPNSDPADGYKGFVNGPASFGSGGATIPSNGRGDKVVLVGAGNEVDVPQGYLSGNLLSDTSIYDGATLASLGVFPGTFIWTWGSGANTDSFTIEAGNLVAEPDSLMLLGMATITVLLVSWSRGAARRP